MQALGNKGVLSVIVEFGLIKKPQDVLITGNLYITDDERLEETEIANIWHQLEGDDANIKLTIHENKMDWVLLMPVHESEDWEVMDMNEYFLQFKCKLNA
ncbi:hypothetical protein [Enterovibrio norvegicus]|uniref:hypothetical protein n=1 Tax=Enterovibrio norvegicus TaxID=188144 RepID=UPI00352E6B30